MQPIARRHVGDRSPAVTVDAPGRFGVRVELPAEGEKSLTIVANAPPLAPRTVRAKVVRVRARRRASSRWIDHGSRLF